MVKDQGPVRVICGSCGARYMVQVGWLAAALEFDCSCGARLWADVDNLFQIKHDMKAPSEITLQPFQPQQPPEVANTLRKYTAGRMKPRSCIQAPARETVKLARGDRRPPGGPQTRAARASCQRMTGRLWLPRRPPLDLRPESEPSPEPGKSSPPRFRKHAA